MSLYKNMLWTVLARYGAQGLMVVANILLARHFGSAGFGDYAFVMAVVMVGNAVSTFGTDMVLIRSISSSGNFREVPASLFLQIFVSTVLILALNFIAPFLPASHALRIYIFALLPLSLFTISTSILRGLQRMAEFSVLHFTVASLQLLAVILLLFQDGTLEQYAAYLLVVQIIGAGFGALLCARPLMDSPWSAGVSMKALYHLIQSSAPLAWIGGLRLLYERWIAMTLPVLGTISMAGLFASSSRIMDAAKLGHLAALTALYPEMARSKADGHPLRTGNLVLFAASLVIAFGLHILADPLVRLLFGAEYSEAIPALRLMAWGIIPYYLVSYYALAFVALEMEMPVLGSLMLAFLILVLLLIWLVPRQGLLGAAWSALAAESLQGLSLWWQWRRYAPSKRP